MTASLDPEMLKKAKGYALRLFKLRPRSTGEFCNKLKAKGYPPELVDTVVQYFSALGYLDDAAFVRAWFSSRLKRYGVRRVARELTEKGIAKTLIASTWEKVRQEYDEEAAVRVIVEKRARLYADVPLLKKKKRLMDYLLRRGFSISVVAKVIGDI
ncbi:MAG: regulatory protein RecX [Candidatus Omnitrophica bacterium]|nr:regulatory protein RecX [Candidatus Omnitrophota bacterium]